MIKVLLATRDRKGLLSALLRQAPDRLEEVTWQEPVRWTGNEALWHGRLLAEVRKQPLHVVILSAGDAGQVQGFCERLLEARPKLTVLILPEADGKPGLICRTATTVRSEPLTTWDDILKVLLTAETGDD